MQFSTFFAGIVAVTTAASAAAIPTTGNAQGLNQRGSGTSFNDGIVRTLNNFSIELIADYGSFDRLPITVVHLSMPQHVVDRPQRMNR